MKKKRKNWRQSQNESFVSKAFKDVYEVVKNDPDFHGDSYTDIMDIWISFFKKSDEICQTHLFPIIHIKGFMFLFPKSQHIMKIYRMMARHGNYFKRKKWSRIKSIIYYLRVRRQLDFITQEEKDKTNGLIKFWKHPKRKGRIRGREIVYPEDEKSNKRFFEVPYRGESNYFQKEGINIESVNYWRNKGYCDDSSLQDI